VSFSFDWRRHFRKARPRRCPCEFLEVEPCRPECSCRLPLMSGGCDRCATYGSYEQQVAAAKDIAVKLDEAYRKEKDWGP
jgi:hypothetical protein